MLRFLPTETRRRFQSEYKQRRIVAILFLTLVLVVLSFVAGTPSYILSVAKRDAERLFVGGGVESKVSQTALLQSLRDIEILKKSGKNGSPLVFQKQLLSLPRSGIRINGFSWKMVEGAEKIEISGTALRRESLVAFVKVIQKDPSFTEINLPVSYLVRDKDIDFVLSGTFIPHK